MEGTKILIINYWESCPIKTSKIEGKPPRMMEQLHLTAPHFQSEPSHNKVQCKVHTHTLPQSIYYWVSIHTNACAMVVYILAVALEVHSIQHGDANHTAQHKSLHFVEANHMT